MNLNYQSSIEIIGEYDVIVAGAGPSGLCAAMSAAREGSKVALIEKYGIVGGNLTIGHVGPLLGVVDKNTMGGEIEGLLNDHSVLHHDTERAKTLLTNWINHKNISVFLSCSVADVIKDNNTVCGVIITTQHGMKALKGRIIVDATGDGVVSYLSGAVCETGRDGDGLLQPATIMFTLAGIDKNQTLKCVSEVDDTILPNGSYLELCKKANAEGKLPKNVNVVRLYKTMYSDTERMVNATQENYVNGLNPDEIFKAEVSLRNQIDSVAAFLKENIDGFENCYVKDSADIVGIRETRRVMGEYIMTAEDMVDGRRFEDVVVHNTGFCIDIHNPDGPGQAEELEKSYTKLYDLPYRVFVPLLIENLFTCGRCISGTHRAHASYRVMNIGMAGGEAVGIAASICAKENVSPRTLDYKKIQAVLSSRGIILFD